MYEVITAVRRRQTAQLERLCDQGLDVEHLRDEALRRLHQLFTVDAAFFATVDPATMLFTTAYAEDPLPAVTELFLGNEYGEDDVNKFIGLADGEPIATLDRATSGDRDASARYREILAPLGLGDELRVALMSGTHCWGVLCLHRADADAGFDDDDVTLLRRLAPKLADGLRRGVALAGAGPVPIDDIGPGIIVVGVDLTVASANREGEQWVAQLDLDEPVSGFELPHQLSGAAARVLHTGEAVTVRLRRAGGGWVSVHASPMHGVDRQVALVLEAAADHELSSLLLASLGLTPAQSRVAALVLQGRSTRQITTSLQISANTVQEHLRAVFDKLGIGSRRELVAVLTGRAGERA